MITYSTGNTITKEVWRVPDVCAYTGFEMHYVTQALRDGHLKGRKHGNVWITNRSFVDRWVFGTKTTPSHTTLTAARRTTRRQVLKP